MGLNLMPAKLSLQASIGTIKTKIAAKPSILSPGTYPPSRSVRVSGLELS